MKLFIIPRAMPEAEGKSVLDCAVMLGLDSRFGHVGPKWSIDRNAWGIYGEEIKPTIDVGEK